MNNLRKINKHSSASVVGTAVAIVVIAVILIIYVIISAAVKAFKGSEIRVVKENEIGLQNMVSYDTILASVQNVKRLIAQNEEINKALQEAGYG
jgi:hypothetical protein